MESLIHFTVDKLTRLPNFFAFLPHMETALHTGAGSLLCFDVKGLSSINACRGRTAGDFVISCLARVLKNAPVRQTDGAGSKGEPPAVYRTGGDEFVVVLPGISKDDAQGLGERLERRFLSETRESGIEVEGLHIGVVPYPVGKGSLSELFIAMGEALSDRDFGTAAMPPWGMRILDGMLLRIKETIKLLEETFDAAHTDAISGLPNHRAGERFLRLTLASSEVGKDCCSVLFIDGDNLKSYNTLLGYEGGNEMIRMLGRVIQQNIRRGDFACRWLSGDEFLVILPRTTRAEAVAVAERIRREVWDASANWVQRVTVSVGVASTETEGWDADRLLNKAIRANLHAKREGKNLVV
ncbi:MAG: GGDEF domain-containing protein [Clostridia bacterium]|nr:hypothetical protein [Bacillota bacterium]MBO2520386.1 hypothetical protein [Bacillota bacterium]